MRYISIPSVVVVILAATSQVVADPTGLSKGAQSILPHGGVRSVIPLPSLIEPEDLGNRAHAHMRAFAPARTSLNAAATSGSPYAGYNFETPASLACIYGLAQQTGGCLAGIVNSSGHFNASSAAEHTQIYQTSTIIPAAYAAATSGSQAALAVAKRPSPNHSIFSASSSNLTAAELDNITRLTGATIPLFIYRSATGQYGGSFLGTSQYEYSSYAGLFEASAGTSSSPKTTAGPVMKISRTGAPPVGSCVNNVDSECDASLAVYSFGLSADTVQTSALYAGAVGSSTVSGSDVVGALLSGRVTGSGVGVGTGAYLEGRRDTPTGAAVGAEVRTANITSSNCFYSWVRYLCGLWITSQGYGTNTTLSAAVHIDSADNVGKWTAGLTIDPNGATIYGIDDESTATYGIYENGTHTYGLLVGPNAGKVGIGTLTPSYPLDVTGSIRTSQALLNSSSAPNN